jgi:hypothetical protein
MPARTVEDSRGGPDGLVAIFALQERGAVKSVVKRLSRWVAGPAALIAGLSMHGLVAVIILTLLVAWIIGSDARATRVARIISACRGDARPLAPDFSSAASPTERPPSSLGLPSSSGRKGGGPLRQQEAAGTVKVSSRRPSDNTVVPQAHRSKQVRSVVQGRADRPGAYRAPRRPRQI